VKLRIFVEPQQGATYERQLRMAREAEAMGFDRFFRSDHIGGWGERHTPRLAARFADEFNLPFAPVELYGGAVARVRQACEELGRDAATMRTTAAVALCCGADEVMPAVAAE
jgi:alkanesulfonate monooxygenase SsuD/methylene tetrahydromethanopterin reductase-like flavin-dependent oxidoreductase (luciferase family)